MQKYKIKLISGSVRILSESEKTEYLNYISRDQIRSIRRVYNV